ncbi:MAG TPA: hypothetical protein ENK18_16830 [Deltaproteobacteria bacterium]|nr:hypothetical protein [Deltaproteobacteria bacterium]
MSRSAERAYTAGTGALGLALAAPAMLLLPTLADGGLAPLSIAGVIALFVGAPAAVARWRAAPEHNTIVSAISDGLADLVALSVIGASVAPWIADAGWRGGLLALLAWSFAWVTARHVLLSALPALLAVGIAVVAGGRALLTEPYPWTLLEPHWGSWPLWLGASVVAGLWMGGIGAGEWSLGAVRRPGERRGPWAGAGAGLLLIGGLAAHTAGRLEDSLGAIPVDQAGHDLLSGVIASLILASAAATVLRRQGPARPRLILGVLGTLWLAGPALGALQLGTNTGLPAAMIVLCLGAARRAVGPGRATLVVAAVLAAGALVLAWPGLPRAMVDAAATAATLAGAFWLVATRATLAGRPT